MLEAIGWLGSAVIVLSMMQQRILRLRVVNLVGCLLQIVYNGVLQIWPVLVLNLVLAAVQAVSIWRLVRTRHDAAVYEVVRVDPDGEYLRHLLDRHRSDIARFFPAFTGPRPDGGAYAVLRGDETVGYVLLHDEGDGVAQVDLDYVTERYRDLTPGEFLFRRSHVLRDAGFRLVRTPPGMVSPYYDRLGFSRAGDRYELALA